jgi:hypothetical protein
MIIVILKIKSACIWERERERMHMCVYTHTNIEPNASFVHLHIISLLKGAAQNPNMKIRIGSQEMLVYWWLFWKAKWKPLFTVVLTNKRDYLLKYFLNFGPVHMFFFPSYIVYARKYRDNGKIDLEILTDFHVFCPLTAKKVAFCVSVCTMYRGWIK